jgi:hypothetical protein
MEQLTIFQIAVKEDVSIEVKTAIEAVLAPKKAERLITILAKPKMYRNGDDTEFVLQTLMEFVNTAYQKQKLQKVKASKKKKNEREEDYVWDNPNVLDSYTVEKLQSLALQIGLPIRLKGKALNKQQLLDMIMHEVERGYQHRIDFKQLYS